jgi:hypothetical protein
LIKISDLNIPRKELLQWRQRADAMFLSEDSRKRCIQTMIHCANSNDYEDMYLGCRAFFAIFLWTYNPNKEPNYFPFALWEFQERYIKNLCRHFIDQEPLLVEKSRDMGVTWLTCGFKLFLFLFKKAFNGHIVGKKEDDLDNGCLDTVFPKIGFMIDNLPAWLLPAGWRNEEYVRFMKFTHPLNNNSITGESANPHACRSRRYAMIFFDEFAMNPYGHAIWRAAKHTGPCRIAVSTPLGRSNKFAELRHNGQVDVETIHWREHPEKDDEWYKAQCKESTPSDIASELDISYSMSQSGIVYKEFEREKNVDKIEYNPRLPLFCAWDFGIGDSTVILWIQTKGEEVRIIDAVESSGKSIDYYIPFITGKFPKEDKNEIKYPYSLHSVKQIAEHSKWLAPVRHFGDPDVKKTSITSGTSAYDILRRSGINIKFKNLTVKDRINLTKKVLRKPFVVSDKIEWVAVCFENYHWPVDENTGEIKESINMKPVHDKYSHTITAFEYFCSNWRPGMGFVASIENTSRQEIASSTFGY